MNQPSDARGLIVDMDGVLWRGQAPLPGLIELFEFIRPRPMPIILATNNATTSPEGVKEKLRRLGVEVSLDEVLTSAIASAKWLSGCLPPEARVLVIGEGGLRSTLSEHGFVLVDSADDVEAVVVGMDRQITYERLAEAALAIQSDALFVGTNPDKSFPTERGLVPGNGALLAALEATTDTKPVVIGKPEPPLFEQALDLLGTPAEDTLVIGDRLETDILGGQRAGLCTALVLTGVTRRDHLTTSSITPDWVYEGLPDLLQALEEA